MSDSSGDSFIVLLSYFPSFTGVRWKEMAVESELGGAVSSDASWGTWSR